MPNSFDIKAVDAGWQFDNSYSRLPDLFYARLAPVPVRDPRLVVFNHALAETLGLEPPLLDSSEGAAIFGGNQLPQGSDPIAQAYAGHQYGHGTMLGDGRAILLGEHITPTGQRFDIQLKGSGQTPFSRGGDGRATLGPMLREYIISEAMAALGIPTTRSLAVVTTGEVVMRDRELPGAILTRVAASHIRVGTFEYAAGQGIPEPIQALADYTIQRHYPELTGADNPYLALLQAVIDRQASLIAQWQGVGFIHGVMNTDNMAISGETIDYGPCAFMDTYDPETVFSSIDRHGRYAYINQSSIAQWNLARFAEALLPLLHADESKALELAQESIVSFSKSFQNYWLTNMRKKLGLFNKEADDVVLITDLLTWMHQNHADFTNTFRSLALTGLPEASLSDWYAKWQARLTRQTETTTEVLDLMRVQNPAVIPRNYYVEEALQAAVNHNDLNSLEELVTILRSPYQEVASKYTRPMASPQPYQTFCGT